MYEATDIKIITSKTCATDVLLRGCKKPFLKQKVDIAMLARIEANAINEKLGAAEVIDMMTKLNIKNSDTDRDIENMVRGMTLIFTSTSNDQVKGLRHAVPESEANDLNRLLGISDRAPFLCVCIIASCTRNPRRTKVEPPAFFKIALNVIRALRDKLLICA